MDESVIRPMKAVAMSIAAPAALYFLIFHHLQCATDGEQLTAAVLGFLGLGAAIRWA